MTIHPAEIEYPTEIEYRTSLVGAGEALTVDADLSNSMLTETTYAGIAALKLFSSGVLGEPMGVSPKEASRMPTLGVDLLGMNRPKILAGAGEALTVDADLSNSMLTETTYAGIAALKLFSSGVLGEPMGVSPKEASRMPTLGVDLLGMNRPKILAGAGEVLTVGDDPSSSFAPQETTHIVIATVGPGSSGVLGEPMGVSPKEASRMPTLGVDLLGMNRPKILAGAGEVLTVGDDPSSSFAPQETTHIVIATVESFSSGVIEEIAQASHEDMVVSLPEPSPLSKLLVQLVTFQQTPEGERWPGAIWPNARAFADARTFISRLPLNEIPLPEISLADDGEVNFFWKNDGVYVDLGFYGTGTCSYFARGKDGRRLYSDATPASEGLPPEITALFAA